MSVRLPTLLMCAALVLGAATALAEPEHPRLTRIELGGEVTVERLIEAGLDLVEVHRGSHCVILEWARDRERLAALGARTVVLDADPGRSAAARSRAEIESRPRPAGRRVLGATGPDGVYRIQTLPPFGSGSMAGFWTLAEVKLELDQLVANDVDDVVADKIDTIGTTLQGRPIWGLKLGKSVVGPDTRPVAYFSALTHAREPEGMQALLYFAEDLVSHYGTDPTATYLLDHRVIYVVPVVNPDGYKVNEDHFFAGGGQFAFGYHRKNARDINGNGSVDYTVDGVDINRNYDFQWVGGGSSTIPTDETYRGTAPFSEPETQAQRDIVALLQPKTGISFHTWSDLYIHPWGYTPAATPDSMAFYEWSDDITFGNNYQSGQGPRILYPVNGEFTDWCYGETVLKPRMYAWTPEVGGPPDGFWPLPSRIVPLAQENLHPAYYVAAIAGPYVRVERFAMAEGALNRGSIAHLTLRARNKGVSGQAGPGLIATLYPLSAGAHVVVGAASLPTLTSLQSADLLDGARFTLAADDTVTLGRVLRFGVDFTAPDGFFSRDTVEVYCGTPTLLVNDDASGGAGAWTTGGSWGIETADPYQPDAHFADSPNANYGNNTNDALTYGSTLDLTRATHAYVLFDGRWDFQADYDVGVVEAKRPSVSYTPLPGVSTTLGNSSGPLSGQSVFGGSRRLWRGERVDLSAFAGPAGGSVNLRFRVIAGNGGNYDGFRIDSIRVLTFDPALQPAPVAVEGPQAIGLARAPAMDAPLPNPARALARLAFSVPGGMMRLEVLDIQGRRVRALATGETAAGRYQHGWDLRDEAGRAVAPGLYVVRLEAGAGAVSRRLLVLH